MMVRIATAQDKEQILRLFDEFSRFVHAEDFPSKIGGDIFDEIISREDAKIFVAEDNGELVGVVTFYLLPNIRHGWHRGHIEDFFVTEAMRGKGVGKLLFDSVKEFCRKNSIKVIKLDSGNELTNAHEFYVRNGGKSTERFFRFDIQ